MNAQDAIRQSAEMSSTVLKRYLDDLTDADLLRRPGPGCNHLAWQLGHLIASANSLLNAIRPGGGASLPAGFAEQHSKETAGIDDAGKFCSKQQYLDLFDRAHTATLAELAKTTADDLDQPSPAYLQKMFPTVGSVFVLLATHSLMHAGQFVPVRRALGKPVVI